jgi:hypothetical protein
MKRHGRDNFYIVGEGVYTTRADEASVLREPSTLAELRKFRFSRLGPMGDPVDENQRQINQHVADAMTSDGANDPDSDPGVPAGYTYLGQFVDHDLTADKTAVHLGQDVTVEELVQGRSPALDLDSLYGMGPARDPRFYESDGVRLRTGDSVGVGFPPNDPVANADQQGFDLPRSGQGSTAAERRAPVIPDARNDENLAVAQTHAMFIRFHNRVVDLLAPSTPSVNLFQRARETVVRHYQWMLRTDFLPRLIDPDVVDDVFTNGRRFFEVRPGRNTDHRSAGFHDLVRDGHSPTMPIEFSVAAYRLGHSMVRESYQWNMVFRDGGLAPVAGTLPLLFQFSGTSGVLSPPPATIADPDSGAFLRLPSNWIADFRRLFDFTEAGRADLVAPGGELNTIKRIDTLLVNPLRNLPPGSFDGRDQQHAPHELNLAFRNLSRAGMVELANGRQMAKLLRVPVLDPEALLHGNGGSDLSGLTASERNALVQNPPLWFYVLREAELAGGRLTGVGARIVAEAFHRAIDGSRTSILSRPHWRPDLGPDPDTFRMVDLLLVACDGRADLLNPLGD